MATTKQYVSKADSTKDYKVDDRATVGQQRVPYSTDIGDGPTMSVVSGVRANPSPSGT